MSDEISTIDELTRPERHIFLSPHYDDIALSCGGTAALLAAAGRTPEVALIFGDHPDPTLPLTSFAEGLHAEWGLDAAEVIAGRRAEETAAAAVLGTKDTYLPFRDAIYRGDRYTSDPVLFGTPATDEADLPEKIAGALGLDNEARTSTRIYAPLAVGRHVDHQQAFAAGVLLDGQGWEVWFYEDLPYALSPGAREDRLAAIDLPLQIVARIDVGGTWTTKIDAIMAYPSQLTTVFGYVGGLGTREAIEMMMSEYAREDGGEALVERLWGLTGARES